MSESIKRKRLSSRNPTSSPIDHNDLANLSDNDDDNPSDHTSSKMPTETPGRRRTLGNRVVLGQIDMNSGTPSARISLGRPSMTNKSGKTNVITAVKTAALDVGQLSSLYSTCIKLASTNKITHKNAWALHLIDHMNDVIQRDVALAHSGEDGSDEYSSELSSTQSGQNKYGDELTNFQKASATLDASMMIYSHRVDYVHTQTYKVLGGLSNNNGAAAAADGEEKAQDGDEDGAGNADGASPSKVKKRARKGGATIETRLHNINVKDSEHDLCCEIDPLYQKYTALFDDGHVSGMLLNNINVYNNVSLVFDSSVVINDVNESDISSEQAVSVPEDDLDVSEMKQLFLKNVGNSLEGLNDKQICYDMVKFRHMKSCLERGVKYKFDDLDALIEQPTAQKVAASVNTSTDGESEGDEYGIGLSDIALPDTGNVDMENAQQAELEYVLNKENEMYSSLAEHDDMDGNSNHDGMYDGGNEGQTSNTQQQQAAASASVPLLQQLGLDLGESDDIFSNNVSNWAGLSHWRYNKPNFAANAGKAAAKPKAQKKKAVTLDFFDLTAPDAKMFTTPTRSTITLPERTDEELEMDVLANKLPVDIQYTARQLQQLFLKPTVLVRLPGKRSVNATTDSNGMHVSDMVVASTTYTAPQVVINDENAVEAQYNEADNSEPAADGASDELAFADETDGATVVVDGEANDGGGGDDDAGAEDYIGDDHLGDLMAVDDKENIDLIAKPQQAEKLNIEYARVAKRVDVKLLKQNIWTQLHTNKPVEKRSDAQVQSFQSSVYKLNTMYNEATLSAVSIPYCFICVLHLANEHSLVLQHKSEDRSSDDYLGDLNVVIPNSITIDSVGGH